MIQIDFSRLSNVFLFYSLKYYAITGSYSIGNSEIEVVSVCPTSGSSTKRKIRARLTLNVGDK